MEIKSLKTKELLLRTAKTVSEALPYIRPLAEELRVNRNTIAKAYSELESIGVIETQPGRGCFLKEIRMTHLDCQWYFF